MQNSSVDIWAVFYAIAAAQGYFLAFALLTNRRGHRRANRFLAVLMLLLSYYLTDIFMGLTGTFERWPHLLHIATPLWYLFPPLAYFYVLTFAGRPVRFNALLFLHLIPFLIILHRMIPFYFLPEEIKLQYWSGVRQPSGGLVVNYLYAILAPVQGLIYFPTALRMIHVEPKYPRRMKEDSKAQWSWLKLLFYAMLTYSLYTFVATTNYFLCGQIWLTPLKLPLAVFSVVIYGIAYVAINQPEKLFPTDILLPKKKGIFLDPQQAKDLADKLHALMSTTKPYLRSDLKYSELAAQLGISVRQLTEILNKEIGQSFHDFVNSYRVREVQQRMTDPGNDNYTLLAISFDSGFSSKASFNRIFKKHTGLTPSEFMGQLKQ